MSALFGSALKPAPRSRPIFRPARYPYIFRTAAAQGFPASQQPPWLAQFFPPARSLRGRYGSSVTACARCLCSGEVMTDRRLSPGNSGRRRFRSERAKGFRLRADSRSENRSLQTPADRPDRANSVHMHTSCGKPHWTNTVTLQIGEGTLLVRRAL